MLSASTSWYCFTQIRCSFKGQLYKGKLSKIEWSIPISLILLGYKPTIPNRNPSNLFIFIHRLPNLNTLDLSLVWFIYDDNHLLIAFFFIGDTKEFWGLFFANQISQRFYFLDQNMHLCKISTKHCKKIILYKISTDKTFHGQQIVLWYEHPWIFFLLLS